MIVEITLKKEDGTVVCQKQSDAMFPAQFKAPYDAPITDGAYKLFAWTYQPIVVLAKRS